MRFQARALRVYADVHLGVHAELVAEAKQLTVDAPLGEHLHALLMHACTCAAGGPRRWRPTSTPAK